MMITTQRTSIELDSSLKIDCLNDFDFYHQPHYDKETPSKTHELFALQFG